MCMQRLIDLPSFVDGELAVVEGELVVVEGELDDVEGELAVVEGELAVVEGAVVGFGLTVRSSSPSRLHSSSSLQHPILR